MIQIFKNMRPSIMDDTHWTVETLTAKSDVVPAVICYIPIGTNENFVSGVVRTSFDGTNGTNDHDGEVSGRK